MPRRLLALGPVVLSAVVACGPRPRSKAPAARPHSIATAVAVAPSPPLVLAGCTDAARKEVVQEIDALNAELRGAKPTDSPDEPVRRIAALWTHPCMPTLARFFPVPEPKSEAALIDVWKRGLVDALLFSVGGLYREEGKPPVLVMPPEVVPEPSAEALSEAGPWICPKDDGSCGRARSYITRAEDAYDSPRGAMSLTDARVACEDPVEQPGATAFENWAACVMSNVAPSVRYPNIPLRVPTSGWLVLSGRRGHYQFADELRSYDLATGAAYVVSSKSALVFGGASVDANATNAASGPAKERGEVGVDQVRELAFLLGTRSLPVRYRESMTTIPVPAGLSFELGYGKGRLPWSLSTWRTSAQTRLAFTFVDRKVHIEGRLTWPSAADVTEAHAADVIRAMEAGLVEGCPRARPPASIAVSPGGVSRLDASPEAREALFEKMGKELHELAASPCRRASAGRGRRATGSDDAAGAEKRTAAHRNRRRGDFSPPTREEGVTP